MKWISVEDELPKHGRFYLTYNGTRVSTSYKHKTSKYFTEKDVTHWMPLPEPPKQQ